MCTYVDVHTSLWQTNDVCVLINIHVTIETPKVYWVIRDHHPILRDGEIPPTDKCIRYIEYIAAGDLT